MIRTWNSLFIDVKATADFRDFQNTLKQELLSRYSSDLDVKTTHVLVADKSDQIFKKKRISKNLL